jgi:uncharacterized OB-fold protein
VPSPWKLPAPAPSLTPETEPFWHAAAEGKLLLRRCEDCKATMWYPRTRCPECGSSHTDWFEASGRGTVYSFTVNHKGDGPYRSAPFVLAYVELDEGPRVLTNIVDIDSSELAIDMRVRAVFEPTGQESALVRFERE